MRRILFFSLLITGALPAQQVPQATDLPGKPFFINATWYIGGAGNWDYLTMDPSAGRLYIAHGTAMQVVDVESGTLAGEIGGFYEARQVALDNTGELGYVSDGGLGKVIVFDRQTLKKISEIDTGANPRSLVFDSLTSLLFVVRANPPAEGASSEPVGRRAGTRDAQPSERSTEPGNTTRGVESVVTVIDTQTQTVLGDIHLPGLLGYAVEDSNSEIYLSVTDRNQVFHFNAQTVAPLLRPQPSAGAPVATAAPEAAKPSVSPRINLDWTRPHPSSSGDGRLRVYLLSPECIDPRALAMDSTHMRLFAACNNRTLLVLNTGTGEKVTALPIGPGVDAVGYDAEHGFLFTANGAAEGSLTIIRQDVTDTYAVIQTLPTRQRASTLAVNPKTGAVYMVTDYHGVDLSKPGGIGTLEQTPITGSFQVLQVSN
jgi:DNA-binding beta-propeller fold protein YncE